MDLENPTDRKVGLWFERERAEAGVFWQVMEARSQNTELPLNANE